MRSHFLIALALAALGLGGCAPADVAGNSTVSATNGEDGCAIDGWTTGATFTAIPVTITQDGGDVAIVVDGGAGVYLNLVVGSNRFNGDVAGDRVSATLIGDNSNREGECAFTYTVDLEATVTGDVIEGSLEYRPVTNGHPDCGVLETCRNEQLFNGTRPPTAD